MTIEAQADFITEVQRACRKAKDSRKEHDLRLAKNLIDDPRFSALGESEQEDLMEAYGRAHLFVSGGGIG